MERVSRGARRWSRARFWRGVRLRAEAALRRARGFQPWMLNGQPGNIGRACKRLIARAVLAGLVVTSTTGGKHAATSWHYSGDAVDLGLPAKLVGTAEGRERLERFQRSEARRPSRYRELFGPDNEANVKNGRRITLAEGSALDQLHDNHVHGAPRW